MNAFLALWTSSPTYAVPNVPLVTSTAELASSTTDLFTELRHGPAVSVNFRWWFRVDGGVGDKAQMAVGVGEQRMKVGLAHVMVGSATAVLECVDGDWKLSTFSVVHAD